MFPRQKSKDQVEDEEVGDSGMMSWKPRNTAISKKKLYSTIPCQKGGQELKWGKYWKALIRFGNLETPNQTTMG